MAFSAAAIGSAPISAFARALRVGTRNLTSEMETEITAAAFRPVLIVKVATATGELRMWNDYGTLTWNGEDYTGVGVYGGFDASEETIDLAAKGVRLTLAFDSALLSTALSSIRQGLWGRCWLGCLSEAGALVADPYQFFAGFSDTAEIVEDGETANLTWAFENRLIDLRRARVRRYTPEDQKLRSPTDRGFDFVAALQDAQIIFGR